MRSSPHAHHALQIVLALEGQLRVRRSPVQRWRRIGAIIVQPDAIHEVDGSDAATVLIAFVEPESGLGEAVMAPLREPITFVQTPIVARWRRTLQAPRNCPMPACDGGSQPRSHQDAHRDSIRGSLTRSASCGAANISPGSRCRSLQHSRICPPRDLPTFSPLASAFRCDAICCGCDCNAPRGRCSRERPSPAPPTAPAFPMRLTSHAPSAACSAPHRATSSSGSRHRVAFP